MASLARLGLVVHPSRDVGGALAATRGWAEAHGVEVFQIAIHGDEPEVAPAGEPGDGDLVVAIGGDGTVLAALRRSAATGRPVLGVACGSLGALAAVSPDGIADALDRVAREECDLRALPVLDVRARDGDGAIQALNDFVVVRAGAGQVRVSAAIDGTTYARWSGDGLILATALGSSAYTIAAGGPILAPGAEGSVLTPLAPHGGYIPSLVAGAGSRWELEIGLGYGGARFEVDGQPSELRATALHACVREGAARLVRLGDEEPFLAALRRRGVVVDSPRMSGAAPAARTASQFSKYRARRTVGSFSPGHAESTRFMASFSAAVTHAR